MFGPGSRLRQGKERAELAGGHPVMHVDNLPLHLRKNCVASAERQQRQLAEDQRK
jgi:hypothetical protein